MNNVKFILDGLFGVSNWWSYQSYFYKCSKYICLTDIFYHIEFSMEFLILLHSLNDRSSVAFPTDFLVFFFSFLCFGP